MMRETHWCIWGSPYLDAYGEEDPELKRGRPLSLNRSLPLSLSLPSFLSSLFSLRPYPKAAPGGSTQKRQRRGGGVVGAGGRVEEVLRGCGWGSRERYQQLQVLHSTHGFDHNSRVAASWHPGAHRY